MTRHRILGLLLLGALGTIVGLTLSRGASGDPRPPSTTGPVAPAVGASHAPATAGPAPVHPWGPSTTAERLDARFASPPRGFTRVPLAPHSFGAFLRALPLAPAGAPVVDFAGRPLYDEGRHPNIVAVADLDVGTKDLQHCADVIIRLDAEWRYGLGKRDMSYRAVSGTPLPYRSYVAGERAVLDHGNLVLRRAAPAKRDTHALFREYLDVVFAWAGTASLERDAKKVPMSDLRPGDFFVLTGRPFGHAVLVLDVAKDASGRVALLLGQSFMPAQTFQVLRPSGASSPWFVVGPTDTHVKTPFWSPFPVTALRRLP
ncbi:MAG: hypothetical protein KC657_38650 [Myxococcales bacterium]|nr:hypothetical protein [Myxococcales bacterium]